MKKFIYVQALAPVERDDAISFRHVLVSALDEDQAYTKGQRYFDTFVCSQVMNDYVAEITDRTGSYAA